MDWLVHVHHTGDYFAVICRKLKYVSGSLTMAIQKVEEKVVAAKKAVRAVGPTHPALTSSLLTDLGTGINYA